MTIAHRSLTSDQHESVHVKKVIYRRANRNDSIRRVKTFLKDLGRRSGGNLRHWAVQPGGSSNIRGGHSNSESDKKVCLTKNSGKNCLKETGFYCFHPQVLLNCMTI